MPNPFIGNNNEDKYIPPTTQKTFKRRNVSPVSEWSVFYNNNSYSGGTRGSLSGCNKGILGSSSYRNSEDMIQGGQPNANILGNCVGYAWGRTMEIYCTVKGLTVKSYSDLPQLLKDASLYNNNAKDWWGSTSWKRGQTPQLGAIMCWGSGGFGSYGHVRIVEKIVDNNTLEISEGHWNLYYNNHQPWEYKTIYRGGGDWGTSGFQGFIYNPACSGDLINSNSSFGGGSGGTSFGDPAPGNNITITDYNWKKAAKNYNFPKSYDYEVISQDVTVTKNFQGIQTAEGDIRKVQGTKLLSYPSLVEVPFVILKVGDYTFGSYTKGGDLNTIARVTYPNFIDGMTVAKVNGTVNQYTINLTYQIEAGNDPNLVDKILSKVGYGLVYISYGDWACPTFIYSEEEALITNVRSRVDFSRSIISYTITCTSNSITLAANMFNFPARNAKPSDVIFEMLQNNQYGLTNMFTGMKNISKIRAKGLIASNDIKVEIPSKEGMDPLSYLNYLVSCMTPIGNDFHSILKDSTYYMTIKDDTRGDLGGPYFTVTEVKSQTKTLSTVDTYEVDVGFPNDDFVTQFSVDTDNSWSLLYAYADRVNNQNYVYSLDDDGNILTKYSPNITTSTTGFITTAAQKNWWTQMTQFPIKATLEIKGLLRPSMLMSYIRVNAFFYGQKHISSGLYIITKQVDNINRNGYKTTLSLTRIGGDDDVITNVTKTVTTQKPAIITNNTSRNYGYGVGANGEYYNINSANVYTKGGGMNTNSTMEQ